MASLGLYDYGARFYSPKLGKFISPDGLVPGAENPQNFNRFSYVRNNPILYNDPTGHCLAAGNVWIPDSTSACNGGYYAPSNPPRTSSSHTTPYTGPQAYEHGLRQFISKIVYQGSKNADDIWQLMGHAYFQEDYAVITGQARDDIINDRKLLETQGRIVERVRSNPRYGKEEFTPRCSCGNSVTFGKTGTSIINKFVLDPLQGPTWTVRDATVNGYIHVTTDRTIYIAYELKDQLDLRPDWTNEERTKTGYNFWTGYVFGPVWHDIMGASDQMQTYAYWLAVIPPDQ